MKRVLLNRGSSWTNILVGAVLPLAMIFASRVSAESPSESGVEPIRSNKAIGAGEFSLAKRQLVDGAGRQRLGGARQDAVLAQVAAAQWRAGDGVGSASTLRQINSPGDRQSVMRLADGGEFEGGGRAGSVGAGGAAGGGAFADFDSLMNLIETTVVPDTWEALGGNSTMAPYPQGVYVDVAGTLSAAAPTRAASRLDAEGSLENLQSLLVDSRREQAGNWRSASPMRCVSLRRLRDEIASRRVSGLALGDTLRNLAGLTEVQYVVFTEDDVILAAPVGGIDVDRGWFVDRETGRTTLRSDFLARCFAAAFSDTPFGCTIDPTPEGMRSAMQAAAQIQSGAVSMGKSADHLRSALGLQRVEVFGAAGDTGVALLMVEADRHMKQLALGVEKMPDGVGNYLDAVDEMIAMGPPDGLLLRLWFTASPQSVRTDSGKRVFELAGRPVCLSGENQRAMAGGARGAVTVDPRSERFVKEFNTHWNGIRDAYPIYGALESMYRAAAVTELVKRFGSDPIHRQLGQAIAMDDETRDWAIAAPRQVESIATLHTVRSGKKRHHVLLASGGVAVSTSKTVAMKTTEYPSLKSLQSMDKAKPAVVQSWWWDVR